MRREWLTAITAHVVGLGALAAAWSWQASASAPLPSPLRGRVESVSRIGAARSPGVDTRGLPQSLRETGLYADFEAKQIQADYQLYVPQYALWSDGATKKRWIFLPPQTAIDASEPDAWKFPIGTRFFKEFSFAGKRVETRLIEREVEGWTYAVWTWNAKETEATLAPPEGIKNHHEFAPGLHHDIPGVADCKACHEGSAAGILGFSTLQLSPEVDPQAPHAHERVANPLTLPVLVKRGLLKGLPSLLLAVPPKIASDDPVTRSALGYLHANCGNCHNTVGPLSNLGLSFWHTSFVRNLAEEPTMRTGVGKVGRYRRAVAAGLAQFHIRPGAPELSTVVLRMRSRSPAHQMPPVGTKRVDEAGLERVERWIRFGLASQAPKTKTNTTTTQPDGGAR